MAVVNIQRKNRNNDTRRPRVVVGIVGALDEGGILATNKYQLTSIPDECVITGVNVVYSDGDPAQADINVTVTIGNDSFTATLPTGTKDRVAAATGILPKLTKTDEPVSVQVDTDIQVGNLMVMVSFIDYTEFDGGRVVELPKINN
jgi:hypothetical protein